MSEEQIQSDWQDWFAADRPIIGREGDRLGRRDFAETVASAIMGWKGQDSLVIALYGPWGCGKSSIKNMVVESLKEVKDGPLIAEFNPWQFANQSNLIEAFFDQLGIVLGKGTVGSQEHKRRLINKWKRYGAYFKSGSDIITFVKKSLPWFFVLFLALFGSTFFHPGIVKVSLAVFGLIALFLSCFSRLSSTLTGYLAAGIEVGKKTLGEIKEELAEELKGLSSPVLVVMDDIDRLTPEDSLALFQIIKANADLPSLVYLLLFQRDSIAKSIKDQISASGDEFLEKIVQVGFDVPVIEQSRLDRILFENIDRLLAIEQVGKKFDQRRWGNLFLGGLQPFFKNLRGVYRYTSTLAFHVAVFRGKSFEVNPIDLIGLEVLRVFEPSVYSAVHSNKNLLTGEGRSGSGEEETRRLAIQGIVDRASENNRDQVKEIIKQLFPLAAWAFGGMHYASGPNEEWHRDLRVCSPGMFDRYFHLAIPEGHLSQSEIDDLLANISDRGKFQTALSDLVDRNLISAGLNALEANKDQFKIEDVHPFTTALFDTGELIQSDLGTRLLLSPADHSVHIIYHFLKKEPDQTKRETLLKEALEATYGISLPVRLVLREIQDAEKRPEEVKDHLITAEERQRIKEFCVFRIRDWVEKERLTDTPELRLVLSCWSDWEGPEGPRTFCEGLASSSDGIVHLARVFLTGSQSHGLEDYVGTEKRFIRLGDIEKFVKLETMESGLSSIDVNTLPPEEKQAVEALIKAIQNRREGKPDPDMFYTGED